LNQPSGFLDGRDSNNGVVIPNSVGRDIIPLILGSADVPNNDFGELPPAGLSGFVWADANNDGIRDPGESGIGNVWIKLTGTDDLGRRISTRVRTASDGSYNFANLRPGTYAITETPPLHYTAGTNILGSLGGDSSRTDQFSNIVVGAGAMGTEYDFAQ